MHIPKSNDNCQLNQLNHKKRKLLKMKVKKRLKLHSIYDDVQSISGLLLHFIAEETHDRTWMN